METGRHKRRSLGQNFLTSRHLVRELVRHSSIGPSDIVVEIGPGRGIITAELARRAKAVVAIEKDAALVTLLRERFLNSANVTIVQGDILQVWDDNESLSAIGSLHTGSTTYKIFANIPYNITARIVRKILYGRCSPAEAYLIVQKDEVDAYHNFVEFGFKSWKKNLRLAYKNAFSYKRWKRVSREIHLPLNPTPTELTFEQWLALFREWRSIK